MDQAQELFEKLQSLKNSEEFLEYCNQILGAVERIHVDFKQKRDSRNPKLEDDDKKNLAKAVSGFANSGGGVLIWGIEDETLKGKPIANIQQFIQKLLELASQVTDPIVGNIDGTFIISNPETGEGYGIVFIPESSLPPHRVSLNNIEGLKNHYFVRSGNSFIIASHTMLEDMFGRRPKPELFFKIGIRHSKSGGIHQRFTLILSIENKGRGVAKSPFMAVKVNGPYKISQFGIDGNGSFGLRVIAGLGNDREQKYGSAQTIVIHSGISHEVTAIPLEIDLSTAKDLPDVVIDYKIAAEGIQLIEGQEIMKISTILSIFEYQTT